MSTKQERIAIVVGTVMLLVAIWIGVFTAIATQHFATEAQSYASTPTATCVVATCRAAQHDVFGQ